MCKYDSYENFMLLMESLVSFMQQDIELQEESIRE